jgi:hypothetical protein
MTQVDLGLTWPIWPLVLMMLIKNLGRHSGWSSYIAEHMKEGTMNNREHVAFLNMWLEKFVFRGKSFGPTSQLSDSG